MTESSAVSPEQVLPRCECSGPHTGFSGFNFPEGQCGGPAAFRVMRDGKEMLVCTRCDLSTDNDKLRIVPANAPVGPYFDYDPIGALCLAFDVEKSIKSREAATSSRRMLGT